MQRVAAVDPRTDATRGSEPTLLQCSTASNRRDASHDPPDQQ
jgi:hypothetical protein